ncbi:MAG: 16S rRNA (adenine(1518)-N(6)/adenine(1519)-N(6))-dimethyltransferase RsmA [Opitutae bacterium]|nr:16S rRNA (adenine(1518)-N(6)/adenine(1519)-N(6))-dimethyltransferase RsmA [Opitutae bacterium]
MLEGPFNLSQTRELLDAISHSPKKWLGQNFLVDGNIVRKSLALAEIAAGDIVVEIGPGLGTLTTSLLQTGARVFAVERDPALAEHLRQKVAPDYVSSFDLLEADAMDFPLGTLPQSDAATMPFKIVANLPYAISTPWMDAVLECDNLPRTIVLMLQKEAADRFSAEAGMKNFGALSIFLEAAYDRAPGHKVPAQCFFPQPKIDSCLLNLRLKKNPRQFAATTKKVVREIFIYRRKQVSSALKKIGTTVPESVVAEWFSLLPQFGCEPCSRPESIPVPAWLALDSLLSQA